MVLQNPRVDFAVFEVARGGILREGLGYERNDVAVVLNVQPDHLGLRGIDTVEQLADVKAVLVEAVPRDGHAVLNADDPLVREMRRRCSGQVVWFSMEEPGSETRDMIDAHCRRGGKALVLNPSERGEMIVVKHGPREMQLAWTHLLPATFGGRARMNVQNCARGRRGGVRGRCSRCTTSGRGCARSRRTTTSPPDASTRSRSTASTSSSTTATTRPGMKMLGDFVDRVGESLESSHELARPSRIGVIATAGDRRDEDMRELGHIAAQHFDVVIVREDVALRGRERGEVAALVARGRPDRDGRGRPLQAGRGQDLDEIEAVRHAMSRANKGDLVVICVDKHAEVMTELENWSPQAQPGAGVTSDAPAADPDYVARRRCRRRLKLGSQARVATAEHVPAVDRDDQREQGADLRRRPVRGHRVVVGGRHVGLGQPGDGLGERERRALLLGEERRLRPHRSPRGSAGRSRRARRCVPAVHVDAVRAAVELRRPQLQQVP